MPPIGETLREARMRQRLDIADVEERTKIRAKYLRALENEEWGLLPGPTFVRTFLRTYAEVVGVDPHLLVEEYRAHHEPREEVEYQQLGPMPSRGGRRQLPGPPRRGAVVAAAVVALLAFLLTLGLLGGDDDPGGGDRAATTAPDTATEPRARRPRPSRPAPAPARVELRIEPIEPTYACLDRGSGTPVVYEGTLDAPRTFRSARTLRLNLGKRSAAVAVGGEPVEVEDSPEPLGLEATRDGWTEIASGDRPCA
jgi:cytoskeleton protein RodZ